MSDAIVIDLSHYQPADSGQPYLDEDSGQPQTGAFVPDDSIVDGTGTYSPVPTPLLAVFERMSFAERKRFFGETEWEAVRAEERNAEAWHQAHSAPRQGDEQQRDPSLPPLGADWLPKPIDTILADIAAGTLQRIVPTVGRVEVPTGEPARALLYEGRINGLAGESGGGKSWIALAIAAEQMADLKAVYYLDHEDSPETAVQRLVSDLGVNADTVGARFRYIHPDGFSDDGVHALVEQVRAEPGALVIIDSTGESLAAAGLKGNADEDVAQWFTMLAKPLSAAGATVLLLDHQVKSEDNAGLWPIGSQRKRAAITGVQYVTKVVTSPTRDSDGLVMLLTAKDRHGAYEVGSTASMVTFSHPVTMTADTKTGEVSYEQHDRLVIRFGVGKSKEDVEREKADAAARRLDADVAMVDSMDPAPSGYRDVRSAFGWRNERALKAIREWKRRK